MKKPQNRIKKKKLYLKFVDTWKKNSPEFSIPRCLETHISALDLERSFLNGSTTRISDKTLDTTMDLSEEFHERQLIVIPILAEFMSWRVFAARDFKGHLHASVPDVVVILHSSCQWIPGSTICDAILEGR